MKIGIDGTCWWNKRGFGRMARELLGAMFVLDSDHEFYLFIDQEPDADLEQFDINLVRVFPHRPLTAAAVANDSRSIADMIQLYKAVAATDIDVMFFPAVYSWFPVPFRLPSVVTLHDAIAEHFPEMIFPDWKGRLFWTLKVKLALLQCDRVMTVSQAAKQEIERYIGVKGSRIDVISEAPNGIFRQLDDRSARPALRARIGVPEQARLIVYVGGLAPHKNLAGLLEGFAHARPALQDDDVHIVLVGDYGGAGFHSNYGMLAELADGAELKGRVHFTGFISDDDLVLLYNDAFAAAMPSFSEGFGLPAVEAMACRTPVLSSNLGSLPEVVGEAGVYFDPYNKQSISDAIITLANTEGLREQLAEIAVDRSATFSWVSAAQLALGYLENVVPARARASGGT
jgi:glycosyltransferase involved in cell wall biosynthesis